MRDEDKSKILLNLSKDLLIRLSMIIINWGIKMVATSRKFVKIEDLPEAISSLLKVYKKIRVEYPSEMESYFLVKGWNKRKGD